ncbi:MAG: ParB/RepB/Spo0J family partition protein [Prevotellaceae bacterium]|jgi:ParB family chromosome partitioning protein|nr:ParB/RepB/Spo0J family partition protein [Prevotellaceae bacterium]
MTKKNALGKGIGALITDIQIEHGKLSVENTEIDIDKIEANPSQPRTSFDENALNELASSIKVHGIIQPLTLRETGEDRYQIISGERRYRAARIAGLQTIPAYIRTANDSETLEMALIENIQREDLDPMEIAFSYDRLMNECRFTHEQLSERVGKKRATVTHYLRLLSLDENVQQAIREHKISFGHAKTLAGIADHKLQSKLAEKIITEELSVRQIEELVNKLKQDKQKRQEKQSPKTEELPERFCLLVELLETKFNNNINIKRNTKGEGSITINFSSDEEIENFIKSLSI